MGHGTSTSTPFRAAPSLAFPSHSELLRTSVSAFCPRVREPSAMQVCLVGSKGDPVPG
eukprot:CAMPEP_0206475868 /NCGR_PEP_ID=MMETSP0324_2-20121206/34355_1 /ASSEMBLY_ACC=CAM_ASM_000836 /TAXON_ID=2866 /ORGANISM="Crypthecodinium cohnii, Strain Seligo" /LENGTH=57 /DNA_ID=CAMNT_0053951347 /DNA_START=342 /DNA_END=512 /DNA_ORIENTATION=+